METVLLNEVILLIGHPSEAIAVVVCSMLVFSGLGSLFAASGPREGVPTRLKGMLAAVVILGLFQAFVFMDPFIDALIGAPQAVRMVCAGVSLGPLSFAMGTCFPYAMRLITPRNPDLVPWAWAINGWTSVAGGTLTVLITRMSGYSLAMAVALGAYAIAFFLVPYLIPRNRF